MSKTLSKQKLIKISEVAKILGLVDDNDNKLTHVLRFWEGHFKKINPIKLKGTRYYSDELIERLKLIKYLLKDKGMTIKGVKLILKKNINTLDDYHSINIKNEYLKDKLVNKTKNIIEKINKIKNGKKNSC